MMSPEVLAVCLAFAAMRLVDQLRGPSPTFFYAPQVTVRRPGLG